MTTKNIFNNLITKLHFKLPLLGSLLFVSGGAIAGFAIGGIIGLVFGAILGSCIGLGFEKVIKRDPAI